MDCFGLRPRRDKYLWTATLLRSSQRRVSVDYHVATLLVETLLISDAFTQLTFN